MSQLSLPGQIVLHLNWPSVSSVIHVLQTALVSQGRLRVLLIVGENQELCQNLAKVWQDSDFKIPLSQVNSAQGITDQDNPELSIPCETLNLPIISLTGVEASLVMLSSCFNVWVHVEPEYQGSRQSLLSKQSNPYHSVAVSPPQQRLLSTETIQETQSWRVSLIFDLQVISWLLRTPTVAAVIPQYSDLKSSDLINDRAILRGVWLQLLKTVQSSRFNSTEQDLSSLNPSSTQISLVKTQSSAIQPADSAISMLSSANPLPAATNPYSKVALTKPVLPPLPNYPAFTQQNQTKLSEFPSPLNASKDLNCLFWEAPIGILYESLDGGILRANPAFCRLTGYTEKQLRHLDRQKISHPEDFALEVRLIQQMLLGGMRRQTFCKRYICRDGSILMAEVSMSLIGEEPEESYLLSFVTDLSERQRAEQEIQQRREREALLSDISAKIRATFDLEVILQTAVKRLRQALNTDRVLAYQLFESSFQPASSQLTPGGICIAEDVCPKYSALKGQVFENDCIPPPYLEAYRCGRLWNVTDVRAENLAPCHHQMLEQVQVRSMMAVGIQRTHEEGIIQPPKASTISPLWGLLVVHHCHAPRRWTVEEQQLLQAVANQMAIAIEQANLVHQLQDYAHELEERVNQRTQSLKQSLQFEQLIRRLTETLRQTMDEDQMLGAAVEGLVNTLGVDGCYASLCNNNQPTYLEVRYQYFNGSLSQITPYSGICFSIQHWPQKCQKSLLAGETFIHRGSLDKAVDLQQVLDRFGKDYGVNLEPHHSGWKKPILSSIPHQVAQLICPILDAQGLIGTLCIFDFNRQNFELEEICLVEQVASQCAIAIRQARLYRQEHQQRLSAEYFRLFIEQSTDVFVEYDSSLRYLSINPAGAALLNRPVAEVIGKTHSELTGDTDTDLESLIRHVFETGEKVVFNHEVSLPVGLRTFETVYAPITDTNGQISRVIGIGQDITEVRHQWQLLQEQNQQLAEVNRLKEEFIATTSHELRTPLTAILGFSSVLIEQSFGTLNEKQHLYMERIHSSGEHLLELINDILDLSRIEADRLEIELQLVFVQDICEGVVSLIQERVANHGLKLEIEVEPCLEYMVSDPRRLKQMLLNLLTNAIKFTPEGSVGLKIYHTPTPKAAASHIATPDTIHFEVWDTGIGIEQADQKRLFTPFSQIDTSLSRKYQGTGLGLAITRKLAELLGGTVFLESRKDQGSRFVISLPLQQDLNILTSDGSYSQQNLEAMTQLVNHLHTLNG
jgi:PAS domain S-box-containing protein